jgi:hypothetical protein
VTAPARRSRTFFHVRVTVLVLILAGVAAWAWRDLRSRRSRNDWDRTLHVAVVLLRVVPTDDAVFATLRERVPALEDRLDELARRYRPSTARPFLFTMFGPMDVTSHPPVPRSDGVVDLAMQSWSCWRYFGAVDERAGVDADRFDTRLYVVVRPSEVEGRTAMEGRSEQGGRTGSAEVEMSRSGSADFALIVVAHELFHTLGAEDKYDGRGKTLVPLGLPSPSAPPRFRNASPRSWRVTDPSAPATSAHRTASTTSPSVRRRRARSGGLASRGASAHDPARHSAMVRARITAMTTATRAEPNPSAYTIVGLGSGGRPSVMARRSRAYRTVADALVMSPRITSATPNQAEPSPVLA